MALEEGDVIAMGVMCNDVQWWTYAEDLVTVSEEGKLATHTANQYSLTHTGEELTEGAAHQQQQQPAAWAAAAAPQHRRAAQADRQEVLR